MADEKDDDPIGKALGLEPIENKILHLVNSGILIPVLDDFLLYHKDSEKYDKNLDLNIHLILFSLYI